MCLWNSQSHEYINSQDTTNGTNGCDRKIAVGPYLFVDIAEHKIALYVHRLGYTKYTEDIFFVDLSWQFSNVLKQIIKHCHTSGTLSAAMFSTFEHPC